MSQITMKELLEAGVHFGHQTKRWNPKMKKYIFGKRNGIYIIDLQKTLKCFREAAAFVTEAASQGKNILFVGTKRQAQDAIYKLGQLVRQVGGLMARGLYVSARPVSDTDRARAKEYGVDVLAGEELASLSDYLRNWKDNAATRP